MNYLVQSKSLKGYLNIISILVLLLTFFKNKIFFIPIFILLPSLYYSDSNSPFLGILIGIIGCFLYYLCVKFSPKKIFLILITLVIFFSHQTFKSLPKHFDESSIQEFEFKIPTSLVDIHRQFIWGFSLSKFFEKPLLGFGPDTSNFIEGGQKEIGHTHTGDMTFIPSHPHNFLVELLLELGIVGTISFCFSFFS